MVWYQHIQPMARLSYTSLAIVFTWPYHRTLRYFTLEPAENLARCLSDPDLSKLATAAGHWKELKVLECTFVSKAVRKPAFLSDAVRLQ
jgi:hypothetical protein